MSRNRLDRKSSLIIAVDFQEKLLPIIDRRERLLLNARTLLSGAALFDIPILVTEQYPKGLGPTVPEIKSVLPEETPYFAKTAYSCFADSAVEETLRAKKEISQVILTGIETPICLLQTTLDLLAAGYEVYFPEDACSGQIRADHDRAVRRLENAGCIVTCVESILYRWCGDAKEAPFKSLSRLIIDRRKRLAEWERDPLN